MSSRRLGRSILVAPLLVLAAACGNAEEARGAAAKGASGGGPGRRDRNRATPVEIDVAKLGRVTRTTTLPGMVEPVRVVGVNAQIAGALGRLLVREGARVREGEPLARIDVPELEAQQRSAEAALEFATSTAQRSEELFKQRIITAMEVERDRAALVSARATLDALRARVAFSTIRASMSGVVTERLVESGDIVSPNQRLFTIADVSTLLTRVQVSELEVGSLAEGASVRLAVDALPGEEFAGRIRRIFPAADSLTRMIPVEVALDAAAARRVRPGYTIRATFRLESRDDAVLVPARAVLGSAGNQTLLLVKDGTPVRRPVRVGGEVDGRVEILSGATAGDTVIVAGANEVREGGQIRIVDPLAPEEGGSTTGVRATTSRDSAATPRRRAP